MPNLWHARSLAHFVTPNPDRESPFSLPLITMKQKALLYKVLLGIIGLLFLTLMAGWGVYILRDALLQNAQRMGMSITSNFAAEERSNFTIYETLLSFGVASLDDSIERNGAGSVEYSLGLYFRHLQTVLGHDSFSTYVIRNGKYIDAWGRKIPEKFDIEQREWYRQALESPGKTIYTDVYADAVTGRSVITLARRCTRGNVVLAFDIYPESFQFYFKPDDLLRGDSFFFCDSKGTVLYQHTQLQKSREEMTEYLNGLLTKIRSGELYPYDSYIEDDKGDKRVVYYTELPNGWYTIVTIPFRNILGDINTLTGFLLLAIVALCFTAVLLAWLKFKDNALVRRTNDTVRVLGNSFYALYRIDYGQKTYEMIKGSDYVRQRLPKQGDYNRLLTVVEDIIAPESSGEFMLTFSCSNIRKLVARRVRDFGGDFGRLFDNEYRWVNVRLLFDESLAPEEVVLCFRDIDAEKKAQIQEYELLKESLEVARQSARARQNFFNNVSHEMRTPLNAIIGMTELAQRHTDDRADMKRYLDRIHFAGNQLKQLIDDILELSRMEQGKFSLNLQPMDLEKCLRDCLAPYVIQAEMEHKTLTVETVQTGTLVQADPLRIAQLLNNLLSNAFKFTEAEDTVSVRVHRLSFSQNGMVRYRIVVQDTGKGMSESFLSEIFKPYMRESGFTTRSVAGTGLGMAITKNLVDQMNGEIHVTSAPGQGSTFTIILPFAVADAEGVHEDEGSTPQAGEASDREAGGEPQKAAPASPVRQEKPDMSVLQGVSVLLAEDNPVNMELARELLGMSGMEVTEAWNGREAVEKFAASAPWTYQIILLDMQMPEMDGCEAARAIRAMKRPDAERVPIIAVTANAFAEDIAATTVAGMNAHVSKPIDYMILCQVLINLLTENEKTRNNKS